MRHFLARKHLVLIALLMVSSSLAAASGGAPETAMIKVAEDIKLATDIYLPDADRAPVILIRTPYGRTGHDYIGHAFRAQGYAVVIQDVRGKYDSVGGDHEPFRHEESDGLATLKWIARRDWCNGKIGMWGISYSGYSGLVLADTELDALASVLSFSGWLEAGDIVKPGGAMHLMLDLPWMMTQQGERQRGLGEFNMDDLFRHLPLSEAMRAAGIRNSTWEDPDFLEDIGTPRELKPVTRPVLHVSGWNDMVYRASLRAWARLSERARAPQKLILGPWYHDQMMIGTFEVGDAHFGNASGFGEDELIALSVRWFDATLKGEKNGMLAEPDVTYFMMDQNAWHTDSDWPPKSKIETERWYVDSGGKANTASGNGLLSPARPSGAGIDTFVFDPHDPVPTLGGANFHFFPEKIGVRDQREIEERDDVLVYTSSPLTEELQITGALRARLHVSTSGKDTDFTAKLVAVRPDGYARIIEEGIARASTLLDELPEPGQPFVIDVEMGHTAVAIPAGHRLRLEISSSNFPKYDRNPNTGEDPFTARELKVARQTVHHSENRASYVELPVRRTALAVAAGSREPLIRPLETKPIALEAVTGDDVDELMTRGKELLNDRESKQAAAHFERVVELAPESTDGHLWLGRAYLAQLNEASMFKKLGLSRKVRASYLRAIELDPDNVEARFSLAGYYFNAPGIAGGSNEKGLEQVEEIRKRDAETAHVLLADMHAGRKEIDKAAAEYRNAIKAAPDNPENYYRLGFLFQQDERWDEAFEAFETGVKLTGDLASLYQIGRTGIFSEQRLERAKAALLQYIERHEDSDRRLPSKAHARWRLGMVYERMGRKDLARREYETALELQPDLEQALDALENLG